MHLDCIVANYRVIKQRIGDKCEAGGVVKADGYGTGAAEVSKALVRDGCRTLFVAAVSEGVIVREAVGPEPRIVILGGFQPQTAADLLKHNLIPAVSSLGQIKGWSAAVGASPDGAAPRPVFIQFDTGMNRLGLDRDETEIFFRDMDTLLKHLTLQCVMSHPACADDLDLTKHEAQYERFRAIVARVPTGVQASFANSFSIFRDPKYHFDLVRPGCSLYGVNPLHYVPDVPNPTKRVVTVRCPVLQLHTALKGEFVGYGATYTCPQDTQLAVIGVGYADGVLRTASGNGLTVTWGSRDGTRHVLPIRGRVSMDMIIADVSDVPQGAGPAEGDMVEMLCDEQDPDAMAAKAGTIGYEVLTSLGRRYKRVYADRLPAQ